MTTECPLQIFIKTDLLEELETAVEVLFRLEDGDSMAIRNVFNNSLNMCEAFNSK